jgi:hypothetical protein
LKFVLRDFLIGFVVTLVIGSMILLLALGLLAKPSPMDAKKPATWSIEELQR